MENEQALTAYNILVLGANGGIGRHFVEIALKQGHRVTAILRKLEKRDRLHFLPVILDLVPMLTAFLYVGLMAAG